MKAIVLDTNILIDYIKGFAPWVDNFFDENDVKLVIPTIVIAEYLNDKKVETKLGAEESKKFLSWFEKQDLNEEIAHILGRILRRKTFVVSAGLADLIIAATTIHLDAKLATRNKADFAKIPDLAFFEPDKAYD